MRFRRLSAAFITVCIVVFIVMLYTLNEMSIKLPLRPLVVNNDDNKISHLESKLKKLEADLLHHDVVVNQIQMMVKNIRESQDDEMEYADNTDLKLNKDTQVEKELNIEQPVKSPPMHHVDFDESTCPIEKFTATKTDIQMLSLYERMIFDDKDGGPWKQGWRVEYDDKQWSRQNKLKVFIVPHSHNDPGWLKTFEEYYRTQTRAIFDNMVQKLNEGVGRKFIWAETSYLFLWWNLDATQDQKDEFRKLLDSGQIEIVTGGWVMNDEANSHWLSIAQQLTTGHQWLMKNLEYRPKNGWSIDPFGLSSSQPYLLNIAGFDNAVIHRVHYRVKKELALNRQLEFKWRQVWDGSGRTDMFTHMMPFYSYDVPHTCGPDPKICCQFDFKRLPGNGVTCPWGVPPKKIIQKNVHERAFLILDQWRKKSQLYRSNAVLVPLGDDFRYDTTAEWDNQYRNYEMLIDYINNNESWNTRVQFGTLSDYFKEVHKELSNNNVPTLSGDFFTYADRNQHYWSGYYTSRPFYKSMDRVLLAYVRAAETITSQALLSNSVSKLLSIQLRDLVEAARRELSLFQHHDGITGTSRDPVREDYAEKLHKAIKLCQAAIQKSAYYLLGKPEVADQVHEDQFFDVDDVWRTHNEIPSKLTITLDVQMPTRRVVLYNSLTFKRHEIVTVIVNTPHVEVFNPQGNPQMSQVSPLITGEKKLNVANNKFQLSFVATVPAMGLAAYSVALRDEMTINKFTSFAKIRLYNCDYINVELPSVFQIEQSTVRLSEDVAVRAGKGPKVVVSPRGTVKAVVNRDGSVMPAHMDLVTYGSQNTDDNASGAYLFIPDGEARPVSLAPYPELITTEGWLKATMYAGLTAEGVADIVLMVSVYDSPSLHQNELEIVNTFKLSTQPDNVELAIRLSTSIANGNVFYTDLNGMQIVKREYFDKLPLQANFYPFPAAAYIQDDQWRLTLLTSAPLGIAALKPGQMEVMQDRRLSRDDNRGMQQGVLDNVRTRHVLKVVLEPKVNCAQPPSTDRAAGQLTPGAHIAQQLLLHPLIPLQHAPRGDAALHVDVVATTASVDVVMAACNPYVIGKTADGTVREGLGMTFHRVNLEQCYGEPSVPEHYSVGSGQVSIKDLVGTQRSVYNSTLTFTTISDRQAKDPFVLCPMEVRSFFVENKPAH